MDPQSTNIKTALCDGDVVVYLAGFGAERVQYKLYSSEEDKEPLLVSSLKKDINQYVEANELEEYVIHRESEIDPLAYALQKAKLILEKVVGHTSCKSMQVYLSDGDNFRDEIATYRKYKGNRDFSKRPHWYDAIRKYLIDYWDAELIKGQEADDVLGIIQCNSNDTIICSTDKDLLQIPGYHYNLAKETITLHDEDACDLVFKTQILTGDSTDNIVGCPGIGKVGAEKILSEDSSWDAIVDAYDFQLGKKCPKDITKKEDFLYYQNWRGNDEVKTVEEFALEMAQLVYIRREEGEIWRPNE